MKLAGGLSLKGCLAAVALGSIVLVLLEYYKTRDMWGYLALTYTDFFSFVIGLVGRPIVSRFFVLDDSFWNTPKEASGLQDSIQIDRDAHGLPYVTASNRDDLCFGQGYVHAAERPFQMEILRLLATGNAASVLGSSMLDTDMITRTVISEDTLLWKLRRLPPQGATCLTAYAQGVTEALQSLPARPIEFVLLGHAPQLPYTMLHAAAVATVYSLMLNRGVTRDFVGVHLRESLGDKWKLFEFGFPKDVPPLNPDGRKATLYDLAGKINPYPSVKAESDWARRGPSAFPEMMEPSHALNPEFGGGIHERNPQPQITKERMQQFKAELLKQEEIDDDVNPKPWNEKTEAQPTGGLGVRVDGSNAWAVSGKFTKSGFPVLAGDPHLEVTAPGFWLPMWVKSTGSRDGHPVRAVGGSVMGTPGIYVGHNEHAAWTQTVAHTDIEDLYVVDINEEGTHYIYDGKQYPLKFIEHKIYVKGSSTPTVHLSRYTHHGPVFSDVIAPLRKRLKKNQALVWASVALRAPLATGWAEKMLYGKSWKDYIEMTQEAQMNEFVSVWATKEGYIGASVSGAVPVRPHLPLPAFKNGSDSTQDWKGLLPPEEVPSVTNPKAGIIVAGNSILADDPKRVLGEAFVPGHRVRRAHQLLAELKKKKKIEVEDLIKMQEDHHSEHGCEFKDFVLKELLYIFDLSRDQTVAENACPKKTLTPFVGRVLKTALESWDCSMHASSSGASIYEVWLQLILQEVFAANKWSKEALFSLLGGGLHPSWVPRTEALNHWRVNLLSAMKNKKSGLLPPGTSLNDVLCRSANDAMMYLSGRLGPELTGWNWGKLRSRYVDHLFAKKVPALRHLLGVGPFKWGGNFGTIKAHHFEPHILRPNDPMSGNYHVGLDTVSLRVAFDLSDWNKARWAYFPGVSGWVGSKHYGDTASLLEDGKEQMLPMPWDEQEIAASLVSKMTIHPKPKERHQHKKRQQQQQAPRQEF